MDSKILRSFCLQHLKCFEKLFRCHAIFGIARIVHDIIADFEQAARIITAADCLRNMSYGLLQKIDMGKVIEIDDGSQLICQLKFFRRRIIRGKHDLLPFEFHSLCHHKLCK